MSDGLTLYALDLLPAPPDEGLVATVLFTTDDERAERVARRIVGSLEDSRDPDEPGAWLLGGWRLQPLESVDLTYLRSGGVRAREDRMFAVEGEATP